MSKSTEAFPKLQQTVIDGRLANAFFRRDQLRQLQESLLQHKDALLDEIVRDSGNTPAEAFAELYMTLSAIKLYHDELKPAAQLQDEYRIARGEDAADALEAVGIVVVVPQNHTFVYSVLIPLAAAIAAGNCVVVVLEQTLLSLPSLLSDILRKSLDRDVYETARTRPQQAGENCIQVIQTGDKPPEARKALISPAHCLAVAIVDRTANLEEAASALVDARMMFSGRSPYAPDIILVNEFTKQDFLSAAVRYSIKYMTEESTGMFQKRRSSEGASKVVGSVASESSVKTITSGTNGSILNIVDRTSLSSLGKVAQRSLYVHAVSSLDDAIEVANDLSRRPLLAVYSFADPLSSKYLLQFTSAYAGFSNTIPIELLVGPAAPKNLPLTLLRRYPSNLFSVPRPQFTDKTTLTRELGTILNGRQLGPVVEADLLKSIDIEVRVPVRLINGYFEIAIVVGLATKLTPIVLGLGALVYFGVQKVLTRANH